MKPISDYLIELLVRYPSSLPEDVMQAVEDFVATDPFGMAVAQFYREFYQELDALETQSTIWQDSDVADPYVRVENQEAVSGLRRHDLPACTNPQEARVTDTPT